MIVNIYDYDKNDNEILRGQCDLRECYPDDGESYYHALSELKHSGRYWDGGGAQPIVLLIAQH